MANEPRVVLSFGIGGNATALLGSGWSHEEARAIWAIGAESRMAIPRPAGATALMMALDVRPYINLPTVPRQRLTVSLNGEDIETFDVTKPTVLECRIPGSLVAKSEQLDIVFKHPDFAKPSELTNTTDDRPLTFAFQGCRLFETVDEMPAIDSDYFVPPDDLLFDGAATGEQFRLLGEGFTRVNLIARGGLKPTGRVLDLGSGNGQKARVLAYYLKAGGSYEGLDIVPRGVEWCQSRYAILPNFRFQLADVFSSHYNRDGRYKDTEYRLPFDDDEFDMVFLSSVFTHMLPGGVANYINEIGRVLKPGGRCVSTFFLINSDSSTRIAAGSSSLNFVHWMEHCRVVRPDNPSFAVGIEEAWVRERFATARLRVFEATYGFWSGGKELLGAYQDVLMSIKE